VATSGSGIGALGAWVCVPWAFSLLPLEHAVKAMIVQDSAPARYSHRDLVM
jgi:hypothetical protein